MGWKGAVRSIIAAERAAQRERARQNRLQEKYQRIQEKHFAIQQAYAEAETHENYLRWLVSIHKDYPELWDWSRVKELEPPKQPFKKTPYEDSARQRLENYFPGLKDRVLGRADKTREKLTSELVAAYERDEELHQKALEEHKQEKADWIRLVALADDVLQKRPNAYIEAIEVASELLELVDIGKYLQFTIDQYNPQYIEAVLYLHGEDHIPKVTKSVLKTGKLSEKKMPIGHYNQLYQDHICSCLLRLASEIFAFVPVEFVLVHARTVMLNSQTGENEWQTLTSVAFNRKTLESINLDAVDPSDSLRNFVHKEKFLKTKGMMPVPEVVPEDIGITAGPKVTGEFLTIERRKESKENPPPLSAYEASKVTESKSCLGITAGLLGIPTAILVGYIVPTIGIIGAILGALIMILRMIDRSMQRKSFSYLTATSLIGFMLMGYVAVTGYQAQKEAQIRAEKEAELAKAKALEQKAATEKVEALIKSSKLALKEGNLSKAIDQLGEASHINSPMQLDAKWLLEDCEKILSGSKAREVLTNLSDEDYSAFKRKKVLSDTNFFKDPDVNSAFINSLWNVDLRPVDKERNYQKELKRKAERAAFAYQAPSTVKSYQQPTKRASYTVYVTRTGSKYHRSGCRYLRSVIPISLADAKNSGYVACSICRP